MSKSSDREIWESTLQRNDNADLFKVKPGGENTTPVHMPPKEQILPSNLVKRINKLEKQVDTLMLEIRKLKRANRKNTQKGSF